LSGSPQLLSHPVLSVCLGLVRAAGRIAPGSERRTLGAEWEAEILHRWKRLEERGAAGAAAKLGTREGFDLLARSTGALVHAVWLRREEWRFDVLMQDIRYALRGLFKRPVFSGVVVATIALAIGATAAIFSVLYGVLLRPLPFDDPGGLVMVWEHNIPRDNPTNVVSGANFVTWRDENTVFEDLAAITWVSQNLVGREDAERVGVVAVNAGFFPMLGVNAAVGRVFLPEEDQPGEGARPALLSHGYWQRQFGGDREVIGRTVNLNGVDFPIIGVLPEGFRFDFLPYSFNATGTQDIWVPQRFPDEIRSARGRWLQVLGRLRPGVSVERAQAEMSTLASRLEMDYPDAQTGWTVNVVPLQSQVVGEARTPLLILFGAVTFVLLIACANVANLLLSRSAGRQQEIALRTALGASRLRLVRQLLTESAILSLTGGALGLLLAYVLVGGLVGLGPDIPRLAEVSVNGAVVGFALGISALTGILFGLAPALRASSPDLVGSLKEGGARAGSGGGILRARSALVVAEIALALILLVGSGLLLRSFANLSDVGVGFETEGLITTQVELPGRAYPDVEGRVRFFEELVERVQAVPGVNAASAITFLPLSGTGSATSFWANDRPIPEAGELPVADIRWIHRDYHQTMGIPLIRGRLFDQRDGSDTPLRVVISETTANDLWPSDDPIGRRISMPWGDTLVAEIIGVVGDVRHEGPETEARAKLYWHHLQWQDFTNMTIAARTVGDPASYIAAIRNELRAMDSNLPLFNVSTMMDLLGETLAARRFTMLVLGLFALVALILASVGVYGVMSYGVSQRTQEFGVRMALGASARTVALQVVKSGLRLVLIAVAIGGVGAFALSRLMRSLVFEISTSDPITFGLAVLFLAGVAALACYWPAHRAGRVDPIEALRFE
jgi:putative ABC transport system permease protein